MDYKFLVESAIDAQKNSFSPIYNFHVGCALLTANDEIIKGCNVECTAHGGLCAERNAISTAIAKGHKEFKAIAVVGGNLENFCYPCGICRQFILDFAPDIDVVVYKKDEIKVLKIKDLLPEPYSDLINPVYAEYIKEFKKRG